MWLGYPDRVGRHPRAPRRLDRARQPCLGPRRTRHHPSPRRESASRKIMISLPLATVVGLIAITKITTPCRLSGSTPVVALDVRAALRSHLQHAAVDDPGGAVDVPSLGAGQESNHRGDLACIAGSAQRNARPLLC